MGDKPDMKKIAENFFRDPIVDYLSNRVTAEERAKAAFPCHCEGGGRWDQHDPFCYARHRHHAAAAIREAEYATLDRVIEAYKAHKPYDKRFVEVLERMKEPAGG